MKLKYVAQHMTELEMGDKTVLFSYNTPVAYHESGIGYFKTNKKWSSITSKHINKWLAGATAKEVDQEVIDNLVK